MDKIKNNFIEAQDILSEFIDNEDNWLKIEQAGNLLVQAFLAGKKVYSCGNGGSMCDAMHFAEELTGRFRENRRSLPAIAISDPGYLSCTANDYGYNYVFSRFLEGMGDNGDILLAISTSGNSENIINACETARKKNMKIIALTGKNGGILADKADLEIRAPYSKYADRAQEIHIKIIHSLIHFVELNLK